MKLNFSTPMMRENFNNEFRSENVKWNISNEEL